METDASLADGAGARAAAWVAVEELARRLGADAADVGRWVVENVPATARRRLRSGRGGERGSMMVTGEAAASVEAAFAVAEFGDAAVAAPEAAAAASGAASGAPPAALDRALKDATQWEEIARFNQRGAIAWQEEATRARAELEATRQELAAVRAQLGDMTVKAWSAENRVHAVRAALCQWWARVQSLSWWQRRHLPDPPLVVLGESPAPGHHAAPPAAEERAEAPLDGVG